MLEQILNSFAKTLDDDLSIVIESHGGSYYYALDNTVYFNPHDFNDCGFLRHLRENHKCAECDNYSLTLWSLLHEIGHHFTLDFCEEDELEIRALCAIISEEVAQKSIPMQDMYFNLESEWEATEWAMRFVARNAETCRALETAFKERGK